MAGGGGLQKNAAKARSAASFIEALDQALDFAQALAWALALAFVAFCFVKGAKAAT